MKKSGFKKTTLIASILAVGIMLFSSAFSSDAVETKSKQELIEQQSIDYQKQWTKTSNKEPEFTIYFPGKASKQELEMPIPGDSESSLHIASHTLNKEELHFSISHTKLPEAWLKYGSSLVLKGALKLLAKHADDADIAGKKSNTFKDLPSLDYSHVSGAIQTTGTLVLCGDRLFSIEVKHPKVEDAMSYEAQLSAFLDSFTPTPINGQN